MVSFLEIAEEAIPNVFCPSIIVATLELCNVKSITIIRFWYGIGCCAYVLALYQISVMDYSALLANLEIDAEIIARINIHRQLVPAIKLLHDFIVEMGTVQGNLIERQKNEAERQKNEQFRKHTTEMLIQSKAFSEKANAEFDDIEKENKQMSAYCSQLGEFCLNVATLQTMK